LKLIQRKTQDPDYWGDDFTVTSEDIQYLSTLLIEQELPRSAEELGRALILFRSRQEDTLIERALSEGTPYQPKQSYQIGESVVFPMLGYRIGEVTRVRPGHNPEYGEFQVIRVKFDQGRQREFASEFTADHPLNEDLDGASTADGAPVRSPEELESLYGSQVGEMLEHHLESQGDFVRLAGQWFRSDLLIEVNEGHLNLAEAVLDMQGGGPLPTEDLLGDLELPEEIPPELRTFSLNYALSEDERFDEVGPAGEVLWFLRRMEPRDVQFIPPHLEYEPIAYDPALLTSEMVALEQQLDDEHSDLKPPTDVPVPVTISLTFPHWRSGTLPLSSHLKKVFPTGRTHRIRFTLVDADTKTEIPAWVVGEGRYVLGLKEWYEQNEMPVGAYIELTRGEKPGTVMIRRLSRRPRREWIRLALPINGRLTFEMRKQLIGSQYDELMVVASDDPEALDKVWTRTHEQNIPLGQLIAQVFPELAKLSPQGTVHASTLYSAINLAMRTPPGPILADLVSSGEYSPVGDNYWVLRAKGF
jgi:hypothetical protein